MSSPREREKRDRRERVEEMKERDREERRTGMKVKTTKSLDCALIGVCAVIRSNTVV